MAMFDQREIDAASDGLKRATLRSRHLPEHEIAAWFFNASDGPQFWVGRPQLPGNYQPLYLTPARSGQKSVALLAMVSGGLICTPENRHLYRDDIDWQELYLAR